LNSILNKRLRQHTSLPRILAFAASVLTFSCLCAPACCAAVDQEPFRRTIIGIYDGADEDDFPDQNNLVHSCAEMPLNYLGMKVVPHDIGTGLPSPEKMRDVRGILVWFRDEKIPYASEFVAWAKSQVAEGISLVFLGHIGELRDSKTGETVSDEEVNGLLTEIGLRLTPNWTDNVTLIRVVDKDSDMVEFERTLSKEIDQYECISSIDPRNRVYLTLERTDIPESRSAAVVITPRGGCAALSYPLFSWRAIQRWRINPFRFFEKAFRLEGAPRYDTTTLFGKRIFYSHIDGDGVDNVSELPGAKLSGEIIKDRVLRQYPALPVTVSFIVSDIDGQGMGKRKLFGLAREILALDNVEMGSHSYTHPLDWERKITTDAIPGYSAELGEAERLDLNSESDWYTAAKVTVDDETYLNKEIDYAVGYADKNLAPHGKKTMVYQWTGDCRPTARAIEMVDDRGLYNINGGDSRMDRLNPSYTAVSPLARQVDGRIQPLTSSANENIYTNLWKGPFYGYIAVIETFQQTETPTLFPSAPRRVSPINVYYHFYSGEKRQSLGALQKVYDYVLTQDVIPIFTSRYVAGVRGFFTGRIVELPGGGWGFSGYGGCRTARFDNSRKYPDLKRSRGILGFTRWNDALYVHLAEGGPGVLFLSDKPPTEPYLKESSVLLSSVSISAEKILFVADSVGGGTVTFANMVPGGRYEVRCAGEANALQASADGMLSVKVPPKHGISVEIVSIRQP